MARPRGQLERSLTALTIGMAQGQQQRRRALEDTHTGEYEQQVHVNVSGAATNAWSFVDEPVQWELPFLYAPLQRRVPFPTPHFQADFEITAGTAELVVMHAQVIGWAVTEQQWYVGATVRFAAQAPALADDAQTSYSAIAHCSFEGFATMAEADEFST